MNKVRIMKAVFIVSLDFELYWGMQDSRTLESYEPNILGGRKAIPELLKLFEKYGIHATWATVGAMFATGNEELKKFLPIEADMPTYENPDRSSYRCVQNNKKTERELPWLYAPSLIEKISKCPGMEIGSHTFSHYYCREKGQNTDQFRVDMEAAQCIAEEKGYEIKSVVLPRNQCEPEYTEVLGELGFKAYRDEENDWIHEKVRIRPLMRILRLADVYVPLTGQGGYIPIKEYGVWNLTGSRMYKPYFSKLAFLERLKIKRIKRQMLHAARHGLVFHLWWHPHNIGVHTGFHMKQLEEIFTYYEMMKDKYGMQSMNMGEAADYFDSRS